jgi:hypothetical protein
MYFFCFAAWEGNANDHRSSAPFHTAMYFFFAALPGLLLLCCRMNHWLGVHAPLCNIRVETQQEWHATHRQLLR